MTRFEEQVRRHEQRQQAKATKRQQNMKKRASRRETYEE
jgi:hypothetical protein